MLKPFDIEQFRTFWWHDLSCLGFEYHQALAAFSLTSNYVSPDLPENQQNLVLAFISILYASRDQGHICLPLNEIPDIWQRRLTAAQESNLKITKFNHYFDPLALPELLMHAGLAEPETAIIDSTTPPRPLVLRQENDQTFVYLRADLLSETLLAKHLATILTKVKTQDAHLDIAVTLSAWMENLPVNRRLDQSQKSAVLAALKTNLFILTGGPGTGKTTTVFHILRGLFQVFYHEHRRLPVIALCAPTGRAAARMGESLRRTRHELDACLQSAQDREFVHLLDHSYGMTLHRLLGITGTFRREPPNTVLPFDIIIVDEASMIDLHIMTLLTSRLGPHSQLILVGDQNQLPSVESGAILAELTQLTELRQLLPLAKLHKVFRSSTQILECAQSVLAGDYQRAMDQATQGTTGLRMYQMAAPAQREAKRNSLISEWIQQEDLARLTLECRSVPRTNPEETLGRLFEQASRTVLLSPVHNGLCGTIKLNQRVNETLRGHLRAKGLSYGHWFPGMMVMAVQNDYDRGLFNGDRGLVYQQAGSLRVYFPGTSAGSAIHPAPATIPGLEPAFALTIHKSQGSEYERVLLFLAEYASAEAIVSRELLYTGMTRAKTGLTLIVEPEAFQRACTSGVKRWSRLGQRLKALLPESD